LRAQDEGIEDAGYKATERPLRVGAFHPGVGLLPPQYTDSDA